jgi:hypothetical protein
MDKSSLQEWSLPTGTRVKINGHPYWLKTNTVVLGSMQPDMALQTTAITGESGSAKQEAARSGAA